MGILDDAIDFAKQKLQHFEAGHDWSHAERVLNLSRKLWKQENAGDLKVIELSAVLHDIADTKFFDGGDTAGGNMAYDFLTKKGFDTDKAGLVRYIVNHISYKNHFEQDSGQSIEFQIVQDADRLDALGAIGIARAFSFGGFKKRPMFDSGIPPHDFVDSKSYKNASSSTINHFYEKLFKLKDMMNTRAGRNMAEERHLFMVQFVERFLSEWEGLK